MLRNTLPLLILLPLTLLTACAGEDPAPETAETIGTSYPPFGIATPAPPAANVGNAVGDRMDDLRAPEKPFEALRVRAAYSMGDVDN
jgi:hypothetical protein